jgi:hypothetical protein
MEYAAAYLCHNLGRSVIHSPGFSPGSVAKLRELSWMLLIPDCGFLDRSCSQSEIGNLKLRQDRYPIS